MRRAALPTMVLATAAFVNCNAAHGDDPTPRTWSCTEQSSSCDCDVDVPGVIVGGGGTSVPRCPSYNCCLLTEAADPSDVTCECRDLTAACDAEAASRRDTTVVASCPPPDEQTPVKCAAMGENCSRQYLDTQQLEGCCAGTLCKPVNGVPVCGGATAEELALDAECRKVEDSLAAHPVIVQPLASNKGPVSLDDPDVRQVAYGPGGCLVSVELSFPGSCATSLVAGPDRDAEGRLIVHDQFPCPYWSGPVEGTLEFTGISCLKHIGSCFTGTLEFRLTTPPSTSTTTRVLIGEPFVLRGSFCDFDGFVETCG